MYNGSLDADAAVFLVQYAENMASTEFCNDLVDIMVGWFETRNEWPQHFIFKGKHMDLDDDGLAFVARYYVLLARAEAVMWSLKSEGLPELLRLEDFFVPTDREGYDFLLLKAILNRVDKKTAFNLEPLRYVEGNSALHLMHNYAFSLLELRHTQQMLKPEVGFPPYRCHERDVKEHLANARQEIEKAKTMVEQRLHVLGMRLRYDSIQREIEALEKP